MKKLLSLIIVLLISVCIAFGGCNFIASNVDDFGQSIGGQSGGASGTGSSSLAPVEEATGIEFKTLSLEDRKELSLVDAISKVEKTSVAIGTDSGSGSGVIIDVVGKDENDVYIITCHHVISSGGDIVVYLPDEDCMYENEDYTFEGYIGNSIYNKAVTLVGGDNVSDIAVIKIDLDKPAVSGNKLSSEKVSRAVVPDSSYNVRKGESIFAIGNPSGKLPGSVATGIVSYLERDILVGEVGNMTLMQIGVSTNPGNSGGGLYNLYGELIGITNAGNTNYAETNFAIPCKLENGNGFINIAKHLIKSQTTTNYGKVPNRWNIGISVSTSQQQMGLSRVEYLYVSKVEVGGNAYGKLYVNDVINSISWDHDGTKKYDIKADGVNFTSAQSAFAFYVALMRTEIGKGGCFYINVTRSGYQNTLDVKIDITNANFIFCDTGY